MERMIGREISCLVPIYQRELGNVTKVINKDGSTHMDDRTIKTVLKNLCQYYTIHMEASRAKYGKVIHQRQSVPIVIHKRLLLIPLKMRKPLFIKDGAYGYVNLYDIKEIGEEEGNTRIFLENGAEILCLHRIKTVKEHMNRGRLIGSRALYDRGDEAFEVFYEQYDKPATKGDIANLKREILELKDVLKSGSRDTLKE